MYIVVSGRGQEEEASLSATGMKMCQLCWWQVVGAADQQPAERSGYDGRVQHHDR